MIQAFRHTQRILKSFGIRDHMQEFVKYLGGDGENFPIIYADLNPFCHLVLQRVIRHFEGDEGGGIKAYHVRSQKSSSISSRLENGLRILPKDLPGGGV
jgi:2-hydroxy-3-keto-5-methylthiopentenyl-1-phosphate phosphatase